MVVLCNRTGAVSVKKCFYKRIIKSMPVCDDDSSGNINNMSTSMVLGKEILSSMERDILKMYSALTGSE